MAGIARDCLPLYCILLLYPTSDLLIDTLQGSRLVDPALVRLDGALFGGQVSVWMERFITPARERRDEPVLLPPPDDPAARAGRRGPSRPAEPVRRGRRGLRRDLVVGMTLYVVFPAVGRFHTLRHSTPATSLAG